MDEAEQYYNKIVEAYANKCINDISCDAKSPPLYEVTYMQHEMSVENGYYDHKEPNIEIRVIE
ncbi:MAG: hypothetical protein WA941_18450 [Nitrososphaeraceae archaeon]